MIAARRFLRGVLVFWPRGFSALAQLSASACAALLLWCSVWVLAADTFLLASKYFVAWQAGRERTNSSTTRRCTRPPTAPFVSLVPRFTHFASGGG